MIISGGGDRSAVRSKHDRPDQTDVPTQNNGRASFLQIPDPHDSVRPCGSKALGIRRKVDAGNVGRNAQDSSGLCLGDAPQNDGPMATDPGQSPAVGSEFQAANDAPLSNE